MKHKSTTYQNLEYNVYNHQQKVHDFFTTYKNHRLMIYCYVMTTKAQKNLIGINVTENETTQSTVVFMS